MSDKEQHHNITLSLPRETWQAMVERAHELQRSFTKEVIWALQEYIRRERRQRSLES
jgi:hypothetical protein